MKKQPSGKVKRLISIDAKLDSRMRKASTVNWSAVASAAFEREFLSMRSEEQMTSLVERLRAEKAESQADAFELGRDDGREYVTRPPVIGTLRGAPASFDELRRVDNYIRTSGHDFQALMAQATPASVAEIISGPDDGIDVEDFWRIVASKSPDEAEDTEYLRGFLVGMFEVFSEVRDQL